MILIRAREEPHLLTELQANGVTTTQAFDPNTGLVQSILAGASYAVSNKTFTFDALGDLTSRTWLNNSGASVTENACYDNLNRLTSALITTGTACTGTGAVTVTYDALGDITQKSDVCATANGFVYGGSGAPLHGLTSIVGTYNGVANPTFAYDANGTITVGAGRTVTATAFNMPAYITDGSNTASFAYDPDHDRYRMTTAGVNTGVTYYLNDPASGALEEESISGGATTWHDYILADGKMVAERFCTGAAPCSTGVSVNDFVLDHLGSIAVIVNASGTVLNRLNYDAWGKRRNPDGSTINCTAGTSPPSSVTRGFTGQEMLDGLCLVNLNARVYDPSIGRFMAADSVVGDDTIPQELNRFSYVLNNPLSLTDPSGLCFLGCFWDSALFRDVLSLAVAATLNFEVLPALEATQFSALTAGQLALNAGISGGVAGAISSGNVKGAALGALEGVLFAEAGNILKMPQFSKGFFGIGHVPSAFIAHGLIGGLTSELGGGRFSSGFLAAGLGSLAPTPIMGQPWERTLDGMVISATLGGAGSVIGGGRFGNGAVTGAFGYMFNDLGHAWAGIQATYALADHLDLRDGAGVWRVELGSFLGVVLDGRADLIHVSDGQTYEIKTAACLSTPSCAAAAEIQLDRYVNSSNGRLTIGGIPTLFSGAAIITGYGDVWGVTTRYDFESSSFPGLVQYTLFDSQSVVSKIWEAFKQRKTTLNPAAPFLLPTPVFP